MTDKEKFMPTPDEILRAKERIREDIKDCEHFLTSSIKGKDRQDLIILKDALQTALSILDAYPKVVAENERLRGVEEDLRDCILTRDEHLKEIKKKSLQAVSGCLDPIKIMDILKQERDKLREALQKIYQEAGKPIMDYGMPTIKSEERKTIIETIIDIAKSALNSTGKGEKEGK